MQFTEQSDWYGRHKELAKSLFGDQEPMFEKFLAATSIQTTPKDNVRRAVHAFEHWLTHGNFDDYKFGLPSAIAQLKGIVKNGEVTGTKLTPFSANLQGDWDKVTIDRWMKRFFFKNPRDQGGSKQVEVASAIIVAVAKKLKMKPAELQAVLWTAVRFSHPSPRHPFAPQDFAAELKAEADKIRKFLGDHKIAHDASIEPATVELARMYVELLDKAAALFSGIAEESEIAQDYDPNQPRVNKGQAGGGQWTKTGVGEGELKNALGGTEVVESEPQKTPKSGAETTQEEYALYQGLGFADLPEGASTYATLESLDPSKTPSLALRDQLVPGDPVTFQGERYIVKNVKDVFAGKVLLESANGDTVLVSLEDVIPAFALSKDAIDVGGDEWNRQTALRLELEYQRAKPELEKIAASLVNKEADEPSNYPTSWDSLSSDDQEKIESEWKQKNYDSYYENEVDYWQQNEAQNEAKAYVANDSSDDEWLSDAVNAWFEARTDNDDPLPPIKPEQLMEAISVSHEYGEEKTDISFDDDALRKAMSQDPEEQLSLAGIEEGDASKLLTDEMREHLREEIESALDTEAQRLLDLGRIEPPDYLGESAQETLDSNWDNMEDSEKFDYGKESDLISEVEDEDAEQFYGTLDKLPEKFDPLNKAVDSDELADYKRTQALARLLSVERAAQLLGKNGLVKDHAEAVADVRELDKTLWDMWKSSSSSDEGKLLQVVTAEELGGRLREAAGVGKELNKYQIIKDAEATYSKIGGFAGLRNYLRAKWETTQYLLDKAGLDTLELYRGLFKVDTDLSPSTTAPADSPSYIESVGGDLKLPNLHVARNGCASMTAKRSVANDWDGSESIVLRASVPRTAAVSVPAYGVNIQSEQEVVIAGTGWKAWDAWYRGAPDVKDVPIAHGPSGKHGAPPYVAPYTKKQAKEDEALLAKLEVPAITGSTKMLDHMKSSKGEEWVGLSKAGDPKLWVGTEAISESTLQSGGQPSKIKNVVKSGLDNYEVVFENGAIANIDHVLTKNPFYEPASGAASKDYLSQFKSSSAEQENAKVKEIPNEASSIPNVEGVDWAKEKKLAASYEHGAVIYSQYQKNMKYVVKGMTPGGMVKADEFNMQTGEATGKSYDLIPSKMFDSPEDAKAAKGTSW